MDAVCTACGTTVRSSGLVAHPEPASLGMAPEDRLRQPGPCVFRSLGPSRRLGLGPSQLASYKHGWVSSIDVREKVWTPGMHIQPVLSFGQCLPGRGLSTPPLRYIRLFCLFVCLGGRPGFSHPLVRQTCGLLGDRWRIIQLDSLSSSSSCWRLLAQGGTLTNHMLYQKEAKVTDWQLTKLSQPAVLT